jgi:hypothetical protein
VAKITLVMFLLKQKLNLRYTNTIMFFNHPEKPESILEKMEEVGYSSIAPVISPDKLKSLCEGDTLLESCLDKMNSYCVRYAQDVFNMMYEQMKLAELREKGEDSKEMYDELKIIDLNRHNLHEAMIDSVNLMSRQLAKKGKDNEWMREVVIEGRAGYARFAMLTFYNIYSNMMVASD